MDEVTRENLVREFRAYLEALPEDAAARPEESGPGDLYSLYVEMAGLKSEVRAEAWLLKSGLDEFRAAFAAVERANLALTGELAECHRRRESAGREELRPILLALLELHDRLAAGAESLTNYTPSFLASFCPREKTMLAAAGE